MALRNREGSFDVSILYISQNGVTTHIGRSQIAPYVLGLAREGFRIHVLTAEPVEQNELIAQYQELFSQAGIRWTRIKYRNKPPIIGPVFTQFLLRNAALRIVRAGGVSVVHCRSFPPAMIGYMLKRKYGVKFIFDFRDFYADWGMDYTRGVKRLLYKRMKSLEGPMLRSADKIVCLTHRATEVLSSWYFQDRYDARNQFQVIPCCADFTHFDTTLISPERRRRARDRLALDESQLILLYLGSLGIDYLLPKMTALFKATLVLYPDACFLFICNSGEELVRQQFRSQKIGEHSMRFISVSREEIVDYISLADLSVVFIRADVTKAGCSPIKVAELLASNVPIVANRGVGDLDSILSLSRNGSVLVEDFEEATLLAAVKEVMKNAERGGSRIRENSLEFDTQHGVARYAEVYRELLNC